MIRYIAIHDPPLATQVYDANSLNIDLAGVKGNGRIHAPIPRSAAIGRERHHSHLKHMKHKTPGRDIKLKHGNGIVITNNPGSRYPGIHHLTNYESTRSMEDR